ncbi:hypothetical protein [Geodermatophilus sp. SYSU D00766]
MCELSKVKLSLLIKLCRLLDGCEELRQAIARDGTTVTPSAGQTRVHSAREPPEELLRIAWRHADDPRGFVTVVEVEAFLRARQRWREERPSIPLPPLDATTRARVAQRDVDPTPIAAEEAAPRGSQVPHRRPGPVVDPGRVPYVGGD